MEKIKSKFVSISAQDRMIPLEYGLHKYYLDDILRYSVSVTNQASGEKCIVRDITTDYFTAAQYFHKVVNGQVTPLTLLDVVSDFIAE